MNNEKVLRKALEMACLKIHEEIYPHCGDCPANTPYSPRVCDKMKNETCGNHISNYFIRRAKEALK